MVELAALFIGDDPAVWRAIGFVVEHDACHVSGVRHLLGAESSGIVDWGLRSVDAQSLDGLPLGLPASVAEPTPEHPNGVTALDHLVVGTPDLGRTTAAIEELGVECRRTRDAGRGIHQAFFRLGAVILELVGPAAPAGDGPPSLVGLAYTVGDLGVTAAFLGERLRPAKDAVQAGRRIATLDRSAGSTVPIAFMSA